MLAVIEMIAGAWLLAISAGPESPFVAYLTVPLVHVAILGGRRQLVASFAITVAGLLSATLAAGGFGQFHLAIVSETTLLIALPSLLWITRAQTAAPLRPPPVLPLTDDDVELLSLLATGMTQASIAEELHLSAETVKARVARLYRRLGARNRVEAIAAGQVVHHGDREEPTR